MSGSVTVQSGGRLAPGTSGIGTVRTGGLNLESGALIEIEFASGSSNDMVEVSNANGLIINGGVVALYEEGTNTPWATPGTYNIIRHTGSIGGRALLASPWQTRNPNGHTNLRLTERM